MMIWATLLFGFLAIIAVGGVVLEEVRSRITAPAMPGPLSGITPGDAGALVLFFAPVLITFHDAIHFVLT